MKKKRETVEKQGEDEDEGNEVGGNDRKEEWSESRSVGMDDEKWRKTIDERPPVENTEPRVNFVSCPLCQPSVQ